MLTSRRLYRICAQAGGSQACLAAGMTIERSRFGKRHAGEPHACALTSHLFQHTLADEAGRASDEDILACECVRA